MASLDTNTIQVRTVYARTAQNGFIPSTHILIAGGDGSTRWNSVSSILELSSFKTVKGNTSTTFSADLFNNILQISTTGVQGTLESYVDSASSTLMLSNYLPPFAVSIGSVPTVNNVAAANVPNAQYLTQVTGQSTIKFLGVGDVQLSTVTAQNAMFVSISTFTSVGYSTISGETFSWRPTLYSTLSTAYGHPSFISSVPFVAGASNWNWGSNLLFSTPTTSRDMYFSSITFKMDNILPYLDLSPRASSRLFVDYTPMLIMPPLYQGVQPMIQEVSTFIQIQNSIIPTTIFGESVTTNYMTSQQNLASGNSNYFNTPIRMQIDPYGSLLSNYQLNNFNPLYFTIYHRFPNAQSNATDTGFPSGSMMTNLTSQQSGLYINLVNQSPLLP
jgi:hypothetical protein